MPISASYHYPMVFNPPGTVKLTERESAEIVALTSASAGVILSSSDVSQWSNIAITINNRAGALGTVAIEFSPNDTDWEEWDTTIFSSQAANTVLSSQIAGNSRNHLRVRSTDTPNNTIITASLHLNNG